MGQFLLAEPSAHAAAAMELPILHSESQATPFGVKCRRLCQGATYGRLGALADAAGGAMTAVEASFRTAAATGFDNAHC